MPDSGHRFLFVTWNGGGNVPPTVVIARRLVERGHCVRVLGPQSLRTSVETAGCGFAPYERVPAAHSFSAARTTALGRLRAALLAPELARAAPTIAFAEDVLAELDRRPADVLVVDFMLAGAIAAAELARLPTAALMHTVYCLPAPGLPPFGPGFERGSSRSSRVRDAVVSAVAGRAKRKGLSDLNQARRCLGLAPVASAADQLARVARVLVLTSEAFDRPAPSLPPNVRYVGPQLDDSERSDVLDLPWPVDDPEPLVVVSFSSRFAAVGVVQRVLDALAELPVRGLLTLGPALVFEDIRAPENVAVRRFIPHGAVLPHAALVVTHAGLGTVMAALARGAPLLCIPLKNDQFENAARVVAAGAGRCLSRKATWRALRGAILQVLNEPRFRGAARRMAEAIAAGGRTRVVEELEALPTTGASHRGV